MLRDEKELISLSRGYESYFKDGDFDVLTVLMKGQGTMIEIYSDLYKVKDKTTDKFKLFEEKMNTIRIVLDQLERVYTQNQLLKRKLIESENELAMYHSLHSK